MDFPDSGGRAKAILGGNDTLSGLCGELSWITQGSLSSAAWPTANLARLIPVIVERTMTVRMMAALIGGTNTGNIDVGIYDESGNLLVSSGSTAVGAINAIQTFDVADTILRPGLYYIATAVSATTASVYRAVLSMQSAQVAGVRDISPGFPLPATATLTTPTVGTGWGGIPEVIASQAAVI